MGFLILSAICLIVLLFYNFFRNRSYWRKADKIPGPKGWPVLGNALQFSTDPHMRYHELVKVWHDSDHKTHKLQMGPDMNVVICTPENIEFIMKHNTQIDKPKEYHFLDPWIGDGLLLTTGTKWRRQRKVITPTFHFKILEQFVEVFNRNSRKLVKVLEEKMSGVIDIHPQTANCSLDIICETAMGVEVNAQDNVESDYVKAVHKICSLLTERMFSGFKRIQWIYNLSADSKAQRDCIVILHELSNRVIANRKEEMREEIAAAFSSFGTDLLQHVDTEKQKYRPFLDLLLLSKLPDGQPLDDTTIRDEVDTFIFEGHDTTTALIDFALYALSKEPEIQEKAFEEQREIFSPDLDKDPTYSDLQEMKYLERVIKETLRLYPSVPVIARRITEDTQLPDGTLIPADTTVAIALYCMHRHPSYYEDPERFDPDRHSDGRLRDNPFIFVPFSAGLRNCVGQKFAMLEVKSILSRMLRRYKLLDAGPENQVKLASEITLKSVNGIRVKLADRN